MENLTEEDRRWAVYQIGHNPKLAPLADDAGPIHLYLLVRGWDYLPRHASTTGRYCRWLPEGGGYIHVPQAMAVHVQNYLENNNHPVWAEQAQPMAAEVLQ